MNQGARYFKSTRLLVISLIVVNLAIILASYRYIVVEKKVFLSEKVSQLQSIADIKINQFIDWRNERISDARYLSLSPMISESFRLFVIRPDNKEYQRSLYNSLKGMFLNRKYESMVALDGSGHTFFSIPANDSAVLPYLNHNRLNLNKKSGQVHTGDFFLNRDGIPMNQISIPFVEASNNDTNAIGWLLLNINLEKNLFPLLEGIPIPSKTIEILLVYREKNDIIYLNRKGHPHINIISLKSTKGKNALPAYKAVRGKYITEEGTDYRGIRVLATTLPVPGSSVVLIVKMDKTEAYSEVHKMEYSIAALAILMVLALTSSVSFFWSRQRNELIILESEKKTLLERFDMFSKFANDALIMYTNDMTIFQVNDKALELYGYSREEFLGMNAMLIRSPEIRSELPSQLETTKKEGGLRLETRHIRKDGTTFPVEVSLRYVEILGNPCFQSIIRDITQRKQFEKALIESEERLRLITNTMPQIVWTARPDGTFDFFNSRFEALTGLHPFKENSINGFIHPEDMERVLDYWKKAVHEIKEHQIRFRLRMKDGNYRWFLCIGTPLRNDHGDLIRWYGSATDIDELENRVAQRTAELSDLYNNAPCGYHSLDLNGNFIKINDTALSWLGYSREEIIGRRSFADLLTPEGREAFSRNFKEFKRKGYVNNLEYEMVRKDGTILPVLLSATAVKDKDSNFIATRTTIIDHTEGKQHENEIVKLNTILQEHGYNLEYANKELEAFTFSVSHDLRAPLRAINGFSRILLDDYRDKLDTEGQKMLETVWNNADHMRQLIDDLLRLSKAGRQELTYARIDMKALFNSMSEEVKQLYPERNIKIAINSLPKAYGDLALLKQVISNLLSNAVKFSGKMKISEIEIGSESEMNELIYYVKDNGTGFDMKYIDELFGVFKRLNNADDYEGTGVGLALVKRIIEKHGGRVWAKSEPEMGATFYFSLPVDKST